MQQRDDRLVRRAAADALLPAEVDGELRGAAELARAARGRSTSGARSSVTSPCASSRRTSGSAVDDALALVDGDRHHRQVLGQRQQAVGAQVVLQAEALDPAEHRAPGTP